MLLDVILDHLREDEVRHIQQVLERDAYIQNQEETRRKKLQGSIRRERIPEKRLSLKLRTGEWMSEMTSPNRASQKRGSEIVRASIRRKISTKQKTETHDSDKKQTESKQKQENGLIENERITDSNLTPETETERVVQNGQPVFSEEAKTSDQAVKISPYKSPLRKTSIRRKKLSSSTDKQVKFDTEKTKKFVYVQTSIDPDAQNIASQDVPSIVIDDGDKKTKIETEKPKDAITQEVQDQISDASSYGSSAYSTGATFESYHNAFAKDMYKTEGKDDEKLATVSKEDTTPVTVSPKVKKVRVVKRKGSSRRKPGPKLTDDDSRNTLFNMPDAGTQEEENKVADVISDEIVAAATQDAISSSLAHIQDGEADADIKKDVEEIINTASAADEVAAELLKMVNQQHSPEKEPYNAPTTEELKNTVENVKEDISKINEDLANLKPIEDALARIEPEISLDDISKKSEVEKLSPKQESSPNQKSTVSGLSDEIMKEYEKMTTVHDEYTTPQNDDIIEVELQPEISNDDKIPEKVDVNPMSTGDSEYAKDATLEKYESLVSSYENEIKKEDSESQKIPEKELPISTSITYEQDKDDEDSIPDLVATYQPLATTELPKADVYIPSSTIEQDPTPETNGLDKQAQSDTPAFKLMSAVSPTEDTNKTEEENKNYSADTVVTAIKDEILPALEEVINKAEDKVAEYIPGAIIDSAASALINEQKDQEESPTKTDKPKKKVMKKVIKKKKPVETEEHSSPKSEPPQQENETPEDPSLNNSRLQRTKTVRKKVIKKKPPPTS